MLKTTIAIIVIIRVIKGIEGVLMVVVDFCLFHGHKPLTGVGITT